MYIAGRQSCEDGGRHCSDVATSQGRSQISSNHQKPEEASKDSLKASEAEQPCLLLDPDIQSLEL